MTGARLVTLFRRALFQIVLGFVLVCAGAIGLCFATIVRQGSSACTPQSLVCAPPLSFTSPAMELYFVPFFVLFAALPLAGAIDRSFEPAALVGPVLIALAGIWTIPFLEFGSGVVIWSELWVFVGNAVIFLGCGLEILGILRGSHDRRRSRRVLIPKRTKPAPTLGPPSGGA